MRRILFSILAIPVLAVLGQERQPWTGVALTNLAIRATDADGRPAALVARSYDDESVALTPARRIDFSSILRVDVGAKFAWPTEENAAEAAELARKNKPVVFSLFDEEVAQAKCPILKARQLLIDPSTAEILAARGRCAYSNAAAGLKDYNEIFLGELRAIKAQIVSQDHKTGRYVYGWKSPQGIDLVCMVFVVGLKDGGIGFQVEVRKK